MRIIIDADACPKGVKNICIELAKKHNYKLIMVIDNAHELKGDFEIIKVEKDKDSADFKIVSMTQTDDIIITQDYGLASMLLDKASFILHPSGFIFNKFNIETLLFQRHTNAKLRNKGKKTKGPKKRKVEDDIKFRNTLEDCLKKY
jgi:hypothetical protein